MAIAGRGFPVQPLPPLFFAGHRRTQSSRVALWLIPGQGGVLHSHCLARAMQSWPHALAYTDRDP